ncbi:MAG TPA: NAD(P)-binding protein, partial [Thermoanaerobaculia bacterium]|nr:NAD(P)-binding protein [Thermoanaerobaculia bacterium]
MAHDRQYQTAIVGGGLAGLTAAVILGRAGVRTIVLERAPRLGGRADSQETKGFTLNVGPHAIYRAGLGIKTLESLVGPIAGGIPRSTGTTGLRSGRLGRLPGTAGALLTTTLLGVRGKLDLVRFLSAMKKVRVEALADLAVGEFLDRSLSAPDARLLAEAL